MNKMKKLVVSTFAAGALLVGPATAASATESGIETYQVQAQKCTGVVVVCTQKQSSQNSFLGLNVLNVL